MPRPKTQLVRHDYSLVTKIAGDGCIEAPIAKAIKVSPRLFQDLKKEDPKLADALAVGKALLAGEMIDLLVQKARDDDRQAMESVLNRAAQSRRKPKRWLQSGFGFSSRTACRAKSGLALLT